MATFKELLIRHLSEPLHKNAYYLMVGSVTTSSLGFIFWIIAARFYATEALGLSSAIISAAGFLSLFAELGLGIGLIRFLPNAKEGNNMINTCLTVNGLASIGVALIFLAGLRLWSPALLLIRQNVFFSVAFVAFTLICTLRSPIANIFIAKRSAQFVFIINVIKSLLQIVLIVLFIGIDDVIGIFASLGLATFIPLPVSVWWFLPKVQQGYRPIPKIQKEILNETGRYSIGNHLGRIRLLMIPPILYLMIVNILGAEMNAYFHIVWTITHVLQLIPSSLFNSLFAEGSNDEASIRINAIKSLKLMFLLLTPTILLLLIIARPLLLLWGKVYSENGTLLLRLIALSAIPWGINYLYISIHRVKKNLSSIIKIAAASACFSLGVSYLLMLKMSIVGVGVGYLMGQSITSLLTIPYFLREFCFGRYNEQKR